MLIGERKESVFVTTQEINVQLSISNKQHLKRKHHG